jgi:hypothetical protein
MADLTNEINALLETEVSNQVEGIALTSSMVEAVSLRYRSYWLDKSDEYWMLRLNQEVNELVSSMFGVHDDTPEHELLQIASICINWLVKRKLEGVSNGRKRKRA